MRVLPSKRLSEEKRFILLKQSFTFCHSIRGSWGHSWQLCCSWNTGSDVFYLIWRTPRKWWPCYLMRLSINSCIDLTLSLHICLLITRLLLFVTSDMLEAFVEKKCQLAPRRQYISTMEWTVNFFTDWFVDPVAIFLLWEPFLAVRANNSISFMDPVATKKGLFAVLPQLLIVQQPCSILPSVFLSAMLVFLIMSRYLGV